MRDGFGGCASNYFIDLQRRRGSRWIDAADTATGKTGAYSVRIADRAGVYRAFTPAIVSGGHKCLAAASRPIDHSP